MIENNAEFVGEIWDRLKEAVPEGLTRFEIETKLSLPKGQASVQKVNRALNKLLNNPLKDIKRYSSDGKELDEDDVKGNRVTWKYTGPPRLTKNQEAIILLTAQKLSDTFLSPDERQWFDKHYEDLKDKSSPGYTKLNDWTNKLQIRSRYPGIYPNFGPDNSKAEAIVYEALERGHGFDASYDSEANTSTYFPVRLQKREGVSYVLCKKGKAPELKALALHRMRNLGTQSQETAGKQNYTDEEIQSYATPGVPGPWGQIKSMKLRITGSQVNHFLNVRFHESPEDAFKTTYKKEFDKKKKVSAVIITITDIEYNYDLESWMLGMGGSLQVIEPPVIREKIKAELKEALEAYS